VIEIENDTPEIAICGVSRVCRPGDSCHIPAGVVYAVRLTAGTKAINVFEEPDRHPLTRQFRSGSVPAAPRGCGAGAEAVPEGAGEGRG